MFVEEATVGCADHRVVRPADSERRWVGDECACQRITGVGTLDEQLAHVRQVEQAGTFANAPVLLEDRAVLDRHPPPGEVDHPSTQGLVATGEWCLMDHGAGPLRVRHEARSAPEVARRPAACATSPRSVSKVNMVGASSKSIQRTSSNS